MKAIEMLSDNPPTTSSHKREGGSLAGLITFDALEARLVDAMRLWDRAPDREAAWLHVRAYWPEIVRKGWRKGVAGEWDERSEDEEKEEPRPLPLTRDEVAEMNEAGELLGLVPERDRKLVVRVLAYMARASDEERARVPWMRIWRTTGGGKPGPDGLRRRYSRAITAMANALNG